MLVMLHMTILLKLKKMKLFLKLLYMSKLLDLFNVITC